MTGGPRPITAHELGRVLLSLPDVPVVALDDCVNFEIRGAFFDADASWATRSDWLEGPAVRLSNDPREAAAFAPVPRGAP